MISFNETKEELSIQLKEQLDKQNKLEAQVGLDLQFVLCRCDS